MQLFPVQEPEAAAMLGHTATLACAVQIDTALQAVVAVRFNAADPAIRDASWIARLVRARSLLRCGQRRAVE